MSRLNVGIIGCGNVAPMHISAWGRLKEVSIKAVCDTNLERAAMFARNWGIPNYYGDITEMLAKNEISAVSIATPAETHADLAIEAMENNCDVVLEKPFASTVREADKIIDCSQRTNRKLTVIHNFRFFPTMIKACSLVRNNLLGKICGVTVFCLLTRFDPMSRNPKHWSHKMEGGRIAEAIPHPLYLLTPFLNELEISSVSVSKVGVFSWMPVDQVTAVLKSASGGLGTIFIACNAARDETIVELFGDKMHLRVNIFRDLIIQDKQANYFEPSWPGAVPWSKGTANLRGAIQSLVATMGLVKSSIIRKRSNPHELIIEKFKNSIIKGSPLPVEPFEAREVVRLAEGICRKIGKAIKNRGS